MEVWMWVFAFFPLFIAIITLQQTNKRNQHILEVIKARKKRGGLYMNDAIKRFIGKDCVITTMNESVVGRIEAVEDEWIVVTPSNSKADTPDIIRVDFVSHITERPAKKEKK